MSKRILIVSHALELGGAERSLIGLLEALDPKRCDIDLFLLQHKGELMHAIPKYVHLLPEVPAYTVLARPMKDTLREGHLLLTGARFIGKLMAYRYAKSKHYTDHGVSLEYSHKFTCPFMPPIQQNQEYDLAISFLTPHYFVAKKVRAKKKIAWIHTDYSRVQVNISSELTMWNAYDYIVSISQSVSKSFLQVFPSLTSKILLIENILPYSLILDQSREHLIVQKDKYIHLLSVGRYWTAKNFDNIPDICSRLIQQGFKIRWYIIGFGGDEPLIQQKISDAHMQDHVILLGKKANPYPYIKACDLYVQPSRYEGKCVSVIEAQILAKPVVITDYSTSSSQLETGVDGVIVPMDNEGCAAGIAALLRNPDKMRQLSANCKKRDYSNAQEVEKIYQLVEA